MCTVHYIRRKLPKVRNLFPQVKKTRKEKSKYKKVHKESESFFISTMEFKNTRQNT